jgi:hypothetical protein
MKLQRKEMKRNFLHKNKTNSNINSDENQKTSKSVGRGGWGSFLPRESFKVEAPFLNKELAFICAYPKDFFSPQVHGVKLLFIIFSTFWIF